MEIWNPPREADLVLGDLRYKISILEDLVAKLITFTGDVATVKGRKEEVADMASSSQAKESMYYRDPAARLTLIQI